MKVEQIMQPKIVRPDSKGRITLGYALTQGISGYLVTETEDHKIVLEPRVEIPAREKWLFDNKQALKKVQQGLDDAANARVSARGSFAQYVDDDIE